MSPIRDRDFSPTAQRNSTALEMGTMGWRMDAEVGPECEGALERRKELS